MSEIIRYDPMSPECLRIATDGDLVRYEDYQALRDECARYKAALERIEMYGKCLCAREAHLALHPPGQEGGGE